MYRLKATKTSLYKLVAEYTDLPGMRRTEVRKAFRTPDYFLRWSQEDGYARAFYSVCMGHPLLSIAVHDIDGNQVSYRTYSPQFADLKERGMVEQFTTAAERRRAACGAQ